MIPEIRNHSYHERIHDLHLISLVQRRLRGQRIQVLNAWIDSLQPVQEGSSSMTLMVILVLLILIAGVGTRLPAYLFYYYYVLVCNYNLAMLNWKYFDKLFFILILLVPKWYSFSCAAPTKFGYSSACKLNKVHAWASKQVENDCQWQWPPASRCCWQLQSFDACHGQGNLQGK